MQPSFFKVLSNRDFTKLLRLPPAFLAKHELRGNVKIRSAHSGRKWNVKVEQMEEENGLHCFTDGWPKFAEDEALQLGQFLVFHLLAKSEFNLVIYETSFCQRETPPPPRPTPTPSLANSNAHASNVKGEKTRNDVVGTSRGEFGSKKSNPLYFEICLKLYQRSRITLPFGFTRAARCVVDREDVCLKYVANKNWQTVVVDRRPQKHRVDLTKGWPRFRRHNKLVYGKVYSFEFDPKANVMYVNEVK